MYLTANELLQRTDPDDIERITSPDESLDGWTAEDIEIAETAIKDASDKINSHLRGVYSLPLATVPDQLKRLCYTIAVKYLYSRKNLSNQFLKDDYEEAIKELKMISEKKIILDIPEPPAKESRRPISFAPGDQKLSGKMMEGY